MKKIFFFLFLFSFSFSSKQVVTNFAISQIDRVGKIRNRNRPNYVTKTWPLVDY
jgi:hypothetical protein